MASPLHEAAAERCPLVGERADTHPSEAPDETPLVADAPDVAPCSRHQYCKCCSEPPAKRHIMAILGCSAWIVAYSDRTNISLAIIEMERDLGYTAEVSRAARHAGAPHAAAAGSLTRGTAHDPPCRWMAWYLARFSWATSAPRS